MFYASMPTAKIRILSDIFTIFASWTVKSIKVIRRAIKIFWRIVITTAIILFAAALIIQLPQVQTFVAEKVVNTLSEKIQGEITFEKIHFKPFTTLILKNAVIVDTNPAIDKVDSTSVKVDTFFRAEYIIASFSFDGLLNHEGIHLDKAFIENAEMNLVIENKPDEGDGDIVTDNLSRIFRLKKPEVPKRSEKEIFHIKNVELENMSFTMKNYEFDRPSYGDKGIDWNDLEIKDINLTAKNLQFKGGIMSGQADRLSFNEKSGYTINRMSGNARVGRGKTIIEDLEIEDPWSDIHLPLFMMSYENVKAFQDFIALVKLDGEISDSFLDFKTLAFFAPELDGNNLKIDISGKVSGCIDDFEFSEMDINSSDGGFSGKASGRMTGLPDIGRTHLDADLKNFNITSLGLGDFISQWMTGKDKLDLSGFADGTEFTLNARANGVMNRLDVDADITSSIGEAYADVRIENLVNTKRQIGVTGNISTEDLDIGEIIGAEILGPTTLRAGLKAKIGSGKQPSEVKIDTLKIDRLHANGYDYSNITAVGNIASDSFDGRIACHDPNLNFLLQGTFALSAKTKNARYKFFTNIGHADLNAINIDKRGLSRINLRASADFTKANTGDLRGTIDLGDIALQNSTGRHDIGNIHLRSFSSDSTYTISMDSKFLHGMYSGSAPVTTFIKDLNNITLKKELPALFKDSTYVWNRNTYGLSFRFFNSMDILSFIMPGLYIDEGTDMKASIDRNGRFSATVKSNRLAFEKNYIRDIEAVFDNGDSMLNGTLNCSEVKFSSISLNNSHINFLGEDNRIGLKFDYDNNSEEINKGEILLRGDLSRDDEGLGIGVEFIPSSIFLNSKEWILQPSELALRKGEMDVKSFAITSGNERISIHGKTSTEKADTLNLSLDRFDLSILNGIMSKDFGIRGAATGNVSLTSPLEEKGILIDLICDSTYFADTPLGVLDLDCQWYEEGENFGINIRNELNGERSIDASGTFVPKNRILKADAELNGLSISYASPLLTDVFSEMEGKLYGRIHMNGPLSDIDISSQDTRIDGGLLRIAYTNVPYHVSGPFHLDSTGAYFDNIEIKDNYTGVGFVNGSINWDHFRNMRFDTRIRVNEIEGINLANDTGEGFYGHLFATGNVNITGPMNSILLTVDAVTAKNGQIHIPVTSTAATGKITDLLKFKEKESNERIDPYEAMMTRMEEREKAESNFAVRLRVNARPDVEAFVEIDKVSGNVLSGRGSGIIDIEADSDSFNINGDYLLNSGSYKFVAMGLVSRDFQIEDGSSIRFGGDIMNSTLDINAVYRTKASLSTLLSDEQSVSNKRTVDCGISITDKLSNPQLGFSIQIPDINPMIQSRVESALSTEDKVQKQFLSLIVSNNFLPDEQSGIVNNSSVLYSNVTEILANQLNNIFHKLDIPLDLGLNYQPNESGNDIFDVAVSTQLFNNRVVVNGNIGNKQYTTSSSQNDVVGDLDIEIKLNRSGAFRLNLFSHSADQFSNYLDNSQRNGVGLMYQREFNSFLKFLKNIFSSKTKRQEAKIQEEQAMIQGEKINMQIERRPEKKNDKETSNGK